MNSDDEKLSEVLDYIGINDREEFLRLFSEAVIAEIYKQNPELIGGDVGVSEINIVNLSSAIFTELFLEQSELLGSTDDSTTKHYYS